MHYSIVRLRGVRVAAVLVEPHQLTGKFAEDLVTRLQTQLTVSVMLVARDQTAFNGVRAYAQIAYQPYLFALLAAENIDWLDLPNELEPEMPF